MTITLQPINIVIHMIIIRTYTDQTTSTFHFLVFLIHNKHEKHIYSVSITTIILYIKDYRCACLLNMLFLKHYHLYKTVGTNMYYFKRIIYKAWFTVLHEILHTMVILTKRMSLNTVLYVPQTKVIAIHCDLHVINSHAECQSY